MKHFVNAPDRIVTEALDGTLRMAGAGRLARLDGYPDIKVVVRADWDRSKVAVVSGGGAGHEPAHAGFVGPGMLTAAVSGEIFASPSVDAVLAAILAVTGPAGCLLVVKNYTGDRLNFGLAAERAKAMGLAVEMVIVADDVAIPGAPQPRGVAGTLFVHKVAGFLAERGASLAEVRAGAAGTAAAVVSLGLSLSSCTVPGRAAEARMTAEEAELGLGIHGEPGIEKIALAPLAALVVAMVGPLAKAAPAGDLALLVNNLGGVPAIEMAVVVDEVLRGPLGRRVTLLCGPAPLMTSLDMKGFSLSLLGLDDTRRAALVAPVGPAAWSPAVEVGGIELRPLPEGLAGAAPEPSADPAARAALTLICDTLIAAEARLNALDAKVGDGDTGSTMATAGRRILDQLDSLPLASPAALLSAQSAVLAKSMGGSSGVLLSILTAAAGTAMAEGMGWNAALRHGVSAMRHYGGAGPGDRTMIDALLPALDALDAGGGLAGAAAAAADGAAATAGMQRAGAGRSAYLAARDLDGVPDPGAVAVAEVLAALARGAAAPGR